MTTNAETWTTLKMLRWTQKFFAKKGIEQPRLDAEVLLGHTLELNRVQLYTHFDRPLSPEELTEYKATIKRRVAREPVAYIVGYKEFWSMRFHVDARVLIPRPDTELLVERARLRARELAGDPVAKAGEVEEMEAELGAAALLQHDPDHEARLLELDPEAPPEAEPQVEEAEEPPWAPEAPLRIADVGTGSGVIAVALARELAYAEVLATDVSEDALEVAKLNAERLLGEDAGAVAFAQGDGVAPLREAGGAFALVVSNPPYIPTEQLEGLMPEVRDHEPKLALSPGDDGLAMFRALVEEAWGVLQPGGYLICEIGFDQAQEARRVLRESSHAWEGVDVVRDPFTQHQRVIEARKPA